MNGKMQRMHSSASNTSYDRDCVARLVASNEALEQRNQQLQEDNQQLCARVDELHRQVEFFKRQLFGSKSEKRLIIDPAQTGLLFDELPKTEGPEPTEQISYTRRKTKDRTGAMTDSGLRFGEDVPVETIEVTDPQIEAIPPEHREVISEEVSHRLAQRPASFVILKYIRPVVKDQRDQKLHTAPAREAVLENSIADVSFLAGMLVDKFCFHLPLYRQHQRLALAGITLSRATLTNLSQRVIELLKPIHDAQLKHILQSRVLAMDETPIRAGPSKKTRGKMHQGWYWPVYGENDEISFIYSPSRGADVVKHALGEHFNGVLVTDGYAAYGKYAASRPAVTAANCWAHTRRQFEQAKDHEPEAVAEALRIIGRLYSIERELNEEQLVGQARLARRQKESQPVVEAFWKWCEGQRNRMDLVPSNPLAKALKYAFERVEELQVFLGDPDVPIDTNHLERALRAIPMGRKNWLFCWTELGARHVGVIQSLLTTCRLHGVNPHTYLVDVLQRISRHPASRVEELTPRIWKDKFATDPLRSDLDRARQ